VSDTPGIPDAPTRTADRDATRDGTPDGATRQATHHIGAVARSARLPAPLQYRDRDRYEIAGEHGRGGLGRVLRARDRELGRTVAIKELLNPTTMGELRFFREALITARLEHPGIVPVHEAGRWSDGTPFYAMKLVAGRPLRERMENAETRDEYLVLVRHVIAVANALAYAHANAIVHRDIKPANILVGDYGETVVIDWGLAKDVHGSESDENAGQSDAPPDSGDLTQAGAVLGTPAFMSPEQSQGLSVDFRTDIYALGIVLRDIIAPRHESRSPLGRWERSELMSIAQRATAQDPKERYDSMTAFAEDIRHCLSSQRVHAHRYSLLQRAWRLSRAHPVVTAAVVVGFAASAAIGAVFSAVLMREQQRTMSANRQLETTLTSLRANQQDLVLQQAKTSLDSDPTLTLAWLRTYDGPYLEKAQEYAASAFASGVATMVMPHPGNPMGARWLNEDATVAVVTLANGTLVRWKLPDEVREISTSQDQSLLPAVAAKTQVVAFGTREGELRLYDDRTGRQQVIHSIVPPLVTISFSPDGQTLLAADSDSTILLGDPASGLVSVRSPVPVHKVVSSPDQASLLVCGAEGSLYVYHRVVQRFERVDFECSSQNDVPMIYSLDGGVAIVAGPRGLARLDVATSTVSSEVELPNVAFGDLATDVDALVVTGYGEIYRVPFKPLPVRLLFSSETALSCMVRHGGQPGAVLLAASDGTALRVDLSSENVTRHHIHPRLIASIAIDDTGARALTTDFREVRVWQVPLSRAWRTPSKVSFRAAFSATGNPAFLDSQEGAILEVDVDSGRITRRPGHTGIAFGIRADVDGAMLSAGWDGMLRRWGEGRSTILAKHDSQVRHFATTEDQIITIDEHSVKFTERATSNVHTIALPESPYRVAANGSDVMVITSEGGVFAIGHGGVRRLGSHGNGKGDIAYNAALNVFVSTGRDGRIIIWSPNGEVIREHGVAKTCGILATSVSGSVAALCNRNLVVVLDGRATEPTLRRETTPEVYSLGFSPNGEHLAVGFAAGELYVWNLRDRSLAAGPRGQSSLTSVQFSPDGRRILATSVSGRVFLWNLSDLRFVPLNAGWFERATLMSIDMLQPHLKGTSQ
jgi:WD40 repeat protein